MILDSTTMKLIKKTVRKIAQQTDYNDHNGSNMTLAQFMQDDEAIKLMEVIQAKHEKAGYMERSWMDERMDINKALLAKAHIQYGTEVRNMLHGAF